MISHGNYNMTIRVKAGPMQAYEALTQGMEHWWTRPDRPITKVGDRSKFTFPPMVSYWTFESTKLIPGQYVALDCVDAHHVVEGLGPEVTREWLDSRLVFVIGELDGLTEIHFEHMGLTPQLLCYDVCEAGWDMFFVDSLRRYLDDGGGRPHRAPDETAGQPVK